MKTLMNILCWLLFRKWTALTNEIQFLKKELRILQMKKQEEINSLGLRHSKDKDSFYLSLSLNHAVFHGKLGKLMGDVGSVDRRISHLEGQKREVHSQIIRRQSWFKTSSCVTGEYFPTT